MGGLQSYRAKDGRITSIYDQRKAAQEAQRKIKLIFRSRKPGDPNRQGEVVRPQVEQPATPAAGTPVLTPAARKEKPRWVRQSEQRDKEDPRYA